MPGTPLFAGAEDCLSEPGATLRVSAEGLFAARSSATREGGIQRSHFGFSDSPAAATA
jgi:hypothetical protein